MKYKLKIITAIIVLALPVSIINSQTDPFAKKNSVTGSNDESGKQSLSGHYFTENTRIKAPFISTSLQTVLGAGQTSDFSVPPIQIDTFPVIKGSKQSIVFTALFVEYNVQIRDWLGFWANINMNGRLGTQTRSLISQGVNLSTGYEFGWLFKLLKNQKSMLSGSISLKNSSYSIIDVKSFIERLVEEGELTSDNKLIKSVPSLTFESGLRYAIGFNKSMGLMAIAELEYGENIKRDESTKWVLNGGASLDYDFFPKTNVPIGLSLGYYQNSSSYYAVERVGNPQNVIFQINYTGRKNLSTGIEVTYEWSKPETVSENEVNLNFINIYGSIKYVF